MKEWLDVLDTPYQVFNNLGTYNAFAPKFGVKELYRSNFNSNTFEKKKIV